MPDIVSQLQNPALLLGYTLLSDVGAGVLQTPFVLCQMTLYSTMTTEDTKRKVQGRSQKIQHSVCFLYLLASPSCWLLIPEGTTVSNLLLLCAPFRSNLVIPQPQGLGLELLRYLQLVIPPPQVWVPAFETLLWASRFRSTPALPFVPQPWEFQLLCAILTSVLPWCFFFAFSKTCLTNSLSSVFSVESPTVVSDWPQ